MGNWTPNFGKTQYKKKNRYSQGDKDVVFRILPQPKGANPEYDGNWNRYLSLNFGYKNMAGKARPFESCLVKKNKVVEVSDPALDRLNDLKAKLEKAKEDGNEPLAAKLGTLVSFQGVYNVDTNYYMNVIGLDGNIGVLKLRYTAKLALDEAIKKLQAAGVEPLSFEDGRFFVFGRTGKNRDTNFTVNVYTEQVDALTSRQVVHKATPEILARLETDGFDLSDLAPKLTREEIAQVVAESDLLTGKSPAIDRFIDARWKAKRAAQTSSSQNDDGPDAEDSYTPPAQAVAPAQTAAPAPVAQAAPKATAQAPVAPKTTQAQSIEEMSMDDFLAEIGVNKATA